MERDAAKPLSGRVELDDAYLNGERTGGKRGRGAPGKTPFVAAVETTPEGKPAQLKPRRVASFCNHSISNFAKRSLNPFLPGRQRRTGLLRGCGQGRVRPCGRQDRLPRCRGADPQLQMGQHGTGEYQGRHRWNLPGDRPETRTALPRRVRISLQPAIRSCRYDAAASLGSRTLHTHAIPIAQAGRGLRLIRTTISSEIRLRKVRKQVEKSAALSSTRGLTMPCPSAKPSQQSPCTRRPDRESDRAPSKLSTRGQCPNRLPPRISAAFSTLAP